MKILLVVVVVVFWRGWDTYNSLFSGIFPFGLIVQVKALDWLFQDLRKRWVLHLKSKTGVPSPRE